MAAGKGSDFLIKIGDGGSPTEIFTTVGGMRSTGMTINNEMVDITTKGADKWRELLEGAGIQSMTLTMAGVFKDSASEESVRSVAFLNSLNNFQLVAANGDTFEGSFQITSYERSGEYNAEEIYTITLESAGTITFTAA